MYEQNLSICLYRGHVERVQFRIQLRQFRDQQERWQLIENFSKMVQQGRETGVLLTFDTSQDTAAQPAQQDRAGDQQGRARARATTARARARASTAGQVGDQQGRARATTARAGQYFSSLYL